MKGAGLRSGSLGAILSMIDPLEGKLSEIRRNLRPLQRASGSLPKTTRNSGPWRGLPPSYPQRLYLICQSQRGYSDRHFVLMAGETIPGDVVVVASLQARNAKKARGRYLWCKWHDVEIY